MTPRVGQGCRYYRDGWRYGVVIEAPKRGKRKNFLRVENPTTLYRDGGAFKRSEWVLVDDSVTTSP